VIANKIISINKTIKRVIFVLKKSMASTSFKKVFFGNSNYVFHNANNYHSLA